jgi:N-acetylglucosaminyl-diphospho-decaprenol L-rhamnosyltransferase
VVTVTYSPGSHLDRFLSSLTVATDRPVTVVIADNGSTDGTPEEALERYPYASCCAPAEPGLRHRRPTARRQAGERGRVLIVANPDVVWAPGSIDELLAAAERGRARRRSAR